MQQERWQVTCRRELRAGDQEWRVMGQLPTQSELIVTGPSEGFSGTSGPSGKSCDQHCPSCVQASVLSSASHCDSILCSRHPCGLSLELENLETLVLCRNHGRGQKSHQASLPPSSHLVLTRYCFTKRKGTCARAS